MAKVLLGFSIVIIGIAAVLGFMTKPLVDAKLKDLKDTKATLGTTKAELKTTKGELDTATANITALNSTVEDQKSKIAAGETALAASKAEAEKAAADVKDKETMIETLNKKIADLTSPTPDKPTENPAMIALQKQVEDANNQAKEAK